jgi:hypothetical protein
VKVVWQNGVFARQPSACHVPKGIFVETQLWGRLSSAFQCGFHDSFGLVLRKNAPKSTFPSVSATARFSKANPETFMEDAASESDTVSFSFASPLASIR